MAAVFGHRYTTRVAQFQMWEALSVAMVRLYEVANVNQGLACLADKATGMANLVAYCTLSLWQTLGRHKAGLPG